MRSLPHHRGRAAAAAALLLLAPAARGDQIVIKGENNPGAKIVNFDQGRLHFRSADGRARWAWINDVDLMIVDRVGVFDDFNEAERFFASDDPPKAVARYERTLRLTQEYWPDLISARLTQGYDRAGQIDKAMFYWVRVLSGRWGGPAAAARLIPRTVPARRDARFTRAIETLDTALAREVDEGRRALLQLVRYDVLRRGNDERAAGAVAVVVALSIPEPARSEPVFAVVLAALSEASASAGPPAPPILASLDRAIRDCPEAALPDFLLLKGELLLRGAETRDDIIRAAWPLLRVVIHVPDHPRAPAALLAAAGALERLGRSEQAVALLKECLEHRRAESEIRQKAESMIARLRSGPSGP